VNCPMLAIASSRVMPALIVGKSAPGKQNPSNQGQWASAGSHFPRYRPGFPTALVRGYTDGRHFPQIVDLELGPLVHGANPTPNETHMTRSVSHRGQCHGQTAERVIDRR
jgi:hypothetical protein